MTTFARGTCWCLRTVLVAMCTPLSTFGKPIEATAARQIQFSIDFEF
jgi:hypothetical protein